MKNNEKPKAHLHIDRSSIVVLLTPAIDALIEADKRDEALKLVSEVSKAASYDEIIKIVKKYVEVIYD